MASEVMTFDSIVSKVRHEIDDNEGGYLNLTGDRVKEVLDELDAAHKREVDELRSLVIELANSLGAADETIRGCAKALGATDFTDSQYRGNLLKKADKWRKAEGDCQK